MFAVPAAAQAHDITLAATCDQSSNVNWQVDFNSFSPTAQPTSTGTVKVDNVEAQRVPTTPINFSANPGTLNGSKAGAGGQAHVVLAECHVDREQPARSQGPRR